MRVIAICGPNHSGTTMLGAILGSSKNWADNPHLGEVHAYYRKQSRIYNSKKCIVCREGCEKWEGINVKHKRPYRNLSNVFETEVFVDSSKTIGWFRQHQEYLEVQYVFIWKDLVSLRQSLCDRQARLKWTNAQLEARYSSQLRNLIHQVGALAEMPGGFVGLSLESLLADPSSMTRRLCDILDLEYFEGKEKFWNFEHHHVGGASSVGKLLTDRAEQSFRFSGKTSPYYRDVKTMIRSASRVYLD